MNGSTQPPAIGFMIPVNKQDFLTIETPSQDPRNICTASGEGTIGAPWYTCENIQLTNTVDAVTARVGDIVTIQVGIQALPTEFSVTQSIFNVQAWVCYPNTVAGETDLALVVPSMQTQAASFAGDSSVVSDSTTSYQQGDGFQWISLSSWNPAPQDFMDQGSHGGHCCIIANAYGRGNGDDVGQPSIANSDLQTQIRVCTDLYQGQRNIVIVPAPSGGHGGRTPPRFGFLSGAPGQRKSSKTTIAVNAIKQGAQVDPLLLSVLNSGPYAGLPLKPATLPPKSVRLARHDCQWNDWLSKIIHEAEEIIEELLGLETHPFGGGHQLHLSLPAQGLQPLRVDVELDPTEPPGTVHSIAITQTDANGARGGIRAGIVVT
jgi:hypothetical protein